MSEIRYTYDSDNRIREVFTSADRYVWHKDAAYKYYLHGPLATTELGHWRNQAMNYTYTLQGWIKGVNTIVPTDNMVGQSVMSYQLGYYKNDYKPIGATQNNVTLWTRAQENIAHQGMYNGNISWMETDLKLFKKPQAMLYKYDQLNRITKSRSLEFSNGNYVVRTGDKKYDENYSYDANGNILTLNRKDDKADVMDDFNYSYYPNSNKLLKHKTTGGTYIYDAIGNLITDNNENLQIAWTPSGKVRSVTKPDTTIYFRYDATGNRILKIVSTTSKNDTTTYVRDASGNVMSIYKNRVVSEVPIYGSSRIGEYMGKEKEGYQTFNLRKYELSNHLGNVLAVISDKVNLYSHGLIVNNKLVLDSARATVVSASDYYPFGLGMPRRQFNEKSYRYGFGSHEKDDEIGGSGSHLSFGDYGYSPKIGRRWNVDPDFKKGPQWSPYAVFFNNPILQIDIDGNWPTRVHTQILRKAFEPELKSGAMTEKQLRLIIRGSKRADNPLRGYQFDSKQFMHSMKPSKVTAEKAIELKEKFVTTREEKYINSDSERSGLINLGMAFHPIMDENSPTHGKRNQDGSYTPLEYHKPIKHASGENPKNIDAKEYEVLFNEAVQKVRVEYGKVKEKRDAAMSASKKKDANN